MLFTGYSRMGKNCVPSRLQNGVNLQMCFVNDSSSDKDSDAEDSRTETSLDTPLSPVSKQSSSLSDRDTGEEDLDSEDGEFWRLQRRLQEEARGALALARPMARMQVEVERQVQLHRRSPVADLLPHLPHISESLMKRSLRPIDLREMSLGQLQVITNDLHSQIQGMHIVSRGTWQRSPKEKEHAPCDSYSWHPLEAFAATMACLRQSLTLYVVVAYAQSFSS
ncbi:hypothetical protein P4O66_017143 [Electrophorus voltai]|uniref:Schwannomin interacting protein 1 C-terminal domain-containing protein n=1 Tax=Electrophorus voltai TaxID=2609070 RepID=A0AAD8YU32_9TELE|nr:hypothetical protein P4O66_017143 [Electrophorus voltai]